MSQLELEKTTTEQWQALVKEAEAFNGITLGEELESYLVFLLMRYMQQPELASKVMALEYLTGSQSQGSEREERMRDVGDQCLLYSGLFPNRAESRHVKISYYVKIGQSAYQNLSELTQAALARMYNNLARSFVVLMDTLLAMRNMNQDQLQLKPIVAYELWQDTRSQQAQQVLTRAGTTALLDVDVVTKH
jgi:hypothetical protein